VKGRLEYITSVAVGFMAYLPALNEILQFVFFVFSILGLIHNLKNKK
jgi:hypothetical protein